MRLIPIGINKALGNGFSIFTVDTRTLLATDKFKPLVVAGEKPLKRDRLIHKIRLGDNDWTVVFSI